MHVIIENLWLWDSGILKLLLTSRTDDVLYEVNDASRWVLASEQLWRLRLVEQQCRRIILYIVLSAKSHVHSTVYSAKTNHWVEWLAGLAQLWQQAQTRRTPRGVEVNEPRRIAIWTIHFMTLDNKFNTFYAEVHHLVSLTYGDTLLQAHLFLSCDFSLNSCYCSIILVTEISHRKYYADL